jgi:hypothetical protein
VHVAKLGFATGDPFENDADVTIAQLVSGIITVLDDAIDPRSVRDKPVVRVVLDVPWPVHNEAPTWEPTTLVGFRPVELGAVLRCNGAEIFWQPTAVTRSWLGELLPGVLKRNEWPRPLIGRFVIDGWAVVAREDRRRHLNGHAVAFVDGQTGRTRLRLPTDDEVTGGQFVQWFRYRARNP